MSRLLALLYCYKYPSIEIPSKTTSPASLFSIIVSILNMVDLPAPEGPISPKIFPYLMVKEMSLIIFFPLIVLDRWEQLMAKGLMLSRRTEV
jgi:hypothetical protein